MKYKIIGDSVSGHCCFECSVIDVTKIQYKEGYVVAETFNQESAILICIALNKLEGFGEVYEFTTED